MLSLDFLDKVAKRLDFHSTAIIFLDFFDKDETSLNITRLHSTHSTSWPNGSIFSSIFCRVNNRVKNRVVWPGPYDQASYLALTLPFGNSSVCAFSVKYLQAVSIENITSMKNNLSGRMKLYAGPDLARGP